MTNEVFTQYRLTWRFADEGVKQSSIFWLPKDKDPDQYISDILNVVELSASEYGYKYTLDVSDDLEVCPKCGQQTVKVEVQDCGDQVGDIVSVSCRVCDFSEVG